MRIPVAGHRILALRKHFLKLLQAEQTKRRRNPNWIDDEFKLMLKLVNEVRAQSGLPEVNDVRLRNLEQLALGHVDYSSKFALHCAELALGERP